MNQHNSLLSMFCGAVLGIVRAVTTIGSTISSPEVFKVVLFGALGALSGLVVKDLYQLLKKKIK